MTLNSETSSNSARPDQRDGQAEAEPQAGNGRQQLHDTENLAGPRDAEAASRPDETAVPDPHADGRGPGSGEKRRALQEVPAQSLVLPRPLQRMVTTASAFLQIF